jgi:hypothetical protein
MSDTNAPANEERLRAAIGPRADYYLHRWREMDASGKKSSWNWAACLASHLWLVYRKMWLALLLFILATLATGMIGAFVPVRYAILLAIGLTFITGGYGNLLYRHRIEKLAAGPATTAELPAKGGVSVPALAIAVVVTAILVAPLAIQGVQWFQAERAARLHSP